MKKYITLFLIILFLTGCNQKNNTNIKETTNNQNNYQETMNNNNYIIIDVRTGEEYNERHIKNAINIPYDEIENKINENKNTIIFVYCKSGQRASIAQETLESLGYTVYNLGGIDNINLEKE